MTAPNYITLTSDDIGANKILRAATVSALDSNPISIAQRGTDAPWLNGIGAIEAITSGSGNWTVPAGVYRIKVTSIGGGGGGAKAGTANGTGGGNTTFGSVTASGGNGGVVGGPAVSGGGASGGDINLSGEGGIQVYQSRSRSALSGLHGHGGAGFASGDYGGAAGGTAIKVFSVEPGDVISYAVGAGGSGGGGADSGGAGIIIIEY